MVTRNTVWWGSALAVLLLQLGLIIIHEPWLDEWQALQIAVESPSLSSLFESLHYEGHPPLWYFFLRFLSALVGPHAVLPVAAAILALSTQAIVLFASPFPRWARIALVVSELLLFEFGTISRGATLGVMLTFSVVALWNSRWAWLPIALLPLVDFFFGVFSLAFIRVLLAESRIWKPGLWVWLLSSLLAAVSVFPADDVVTALAPGRSVIDGLWAWLGRIGTVVAPFQWDDGPQWNSGLPFDLHFALWPAFFYLCYDQTKNREPDQLIVFAFLVLQCAFSLFAYPLHVRHVMLAAVLLIALEWRREAAGAAMRLPFRIWLISLAICGLATAAINFAGPFDTARQAAARIRSLGLENESWISWPDSHAQGIAAISGMQFERIYRNCSGTFIRWDSGVNIYSRAQLASWLRARAAQRGRFHLLTDRKLDFPTLVAVGEVPGGYDGNAYFLYTINPNAAPEPPPHPCFPKHRFLPADL